MQRSSVIAATGVCGILLLLGLGMNQSQRQDVPRANDRVLQTVGSPDGRVSVYLVTREADSLSADILKVFVSKTGQHWYDGEMVMEGRRFSTMGAPLWLNSDRLCIVGSRDGVEEQKDRVEVAGRAVRIQIGRTVESCIDAFGKQVS